MSSWQNWREKYGLFPIAPRRARKNQAAKSIQIRPKETRQPDIEKNVLTGGGRYRDATIAGSTAKISTRRFFDFPLLDLFEVTGRCSPQPQATKLDGDTPRDCK